MIENDKARMSNVECRANDEAQMTKSALRIEEPLRTWSLGVPSSFGIRASSFHRTIVSPRVGPTLTMDNFAPASSLMYLTYFLVAEGSCENLRAVCIDVFQPGTSS